MTPEQESLINKAFLLCNDSLNLLNGYIKGEVLNLDVVKKSMEKTYSTIYDLHKAVDWST